jgi:hypothetical protein
MMGEVTTSLRGRRARSEGAELTGADPSITSPIHTAVDQAEARCCKGDEIVDVRSPACALTHRSCYRSAGVASPERDPFLETKCRLAFDRLREDEHHGGDGRTRVVRLSRSPEIDPPPVGPSGTPLGLFVAAIGSWNEVALVAVDALNVRGL